MSGIDISKRFEVEFANYFDRKYSLTYPNGTTALLVAMWAAGLRRGDEVICPSLTYWASAMQALSLGGAITFADVQRDSLCLDPNDIERHIGPRTKAIMVVHYCGYPADMDSIMRVAHKHRLRVIEDVSHAQGSLYKGRMVGSFGDVAAMSLMGAKSFAIGEGGILITDDQEIYERAIAFAHYIRHGELTLPELKRFSGIPLGGIKGRLNQTCAAMGRVQLKYYPERIATIQQAMNRFWDLLENVPGLYPHRPAKDSGSTMGGWYNPLGLYKPEELGGLSVMNFIKAVQAEGGRPGRGLETPLHLHPIFQNADIYGDGLPTQHVNATRDLSRPRGSLPITEESTSRAFGIPWFKHDRAERIERYAAAYKKVAEHADELTGEELPM
jgi:dTDP-4-amino-4,6-dideoxygalactose transaminase